MIDMGLQAGPYGKNSTHEPPLSLQVLKDNPHGIDLGPLVPSLLERLCTEDKKIHLLWADIPVDIKRLSTDSPTVAKGELLLIGRRHVRSNNSWMHNSHRLVKGKPRWQCLMHPDDLAELSIMDGQQVVISSVAGEVTTQVQASDDMMPGVISVPHGWGHKREGVQLSIASQQEGINMNDLTDDAQYDKLSGNAALNGVPVRVTAA